MSHLVLMVTYAALVGAFFALLWKRERAAQVKLFAKIFLGLVIGGWLVAWLMFSFPSGPPSPIP